MNAKLKNKWVKALRSGKYKQGVDKLKSCYGGKLEFCCLGVLRHIEHPKSTLIHPKDEYLHPRHLNEFALSDELQRSLGKKNDNGWSFKKIATWIEKNL